MTSRLKERGSDKASQKGPQCKSSTKGDTQKAGSRCHPVQGHHQSTRRQAERGIFYFVAKSTNLHKLEQELMESSHFRNWLHIIIAGNKRPIVSCAVNHFKQEICFEAIPTVMLFLLWDHRCHSFPFIHRTTQEFITDHCHSWQVSYSKLRKGGEIFTWTHMHTRTAFTCFMFIFYLQYVYPAFLLQYVLEAAF